MKKIVVGCLLISLLILCFSMTASGIKVWPGKHTINIYKWYSPSESVDRPKIQVTNTESYDITVVLSVDNPGIKTLTEGYSFIPDLSWIKIYPDELVIPAGSTETFEVSIEIPESEQSSLYNERWETFVVITPPLKSGGGLNIQTEVAIKLFIKTPVGEASIIPSFYIFLITLILIFFMLTALYFKDRKKRNAELFYFKKKK